MTNNEEINCVKENQSSYLSSIRTRSLIEDGDTYDDFPPIVSVPKELKQTFPTLINKPFFVDNFLWSSAKAQYTQVFAVDIPSGILVNDVAKTPFKVSAMYRAKLCAYLQVTGTTQHQGTILVAAIPFNSVGTTTTQLTRNSLNSLLQAPHVFLSANEATPVCIEIPFYSNTKLRHCNLTDKQWAMNFDFDYATLVGVVLNPLLPPTGGSNILSISAHAMFKKAEFYVPANRDIQWSAESVIVEQPPSLEERLRACEAKIEKCERETKKIKCCMLSKACFSCLCCVAPPTFCAEARVITNLADGVAKLAKSTAGDIIDVARGAFRFYTGFHNPNIPMIQHRSIVGQRNFTNSVDVPTYQEKLDPYANHDRIVNEPTFYTTKDEMLISNIISKPQYISTFTLSTTGPTATSGNVVFSRPITPLQEKISATSVDSATMSTPLQVLGMMSTMWSGTLRLHIQSAMSNFHCCKLMIVKNYTPNDEVLMNLPPMDDVGNLLCTTIEFSGGGQVQTVDLPYCSPLEELPIMNVASANAMSHGMYYIYVVQPLIANGSVATTASFNVYISAGEDFSFYGYSLNRLIPVKLHVAFAKQEEGVSASMLNMIHGKKEGQKKYIAHLNNNANKINTKKTVRLLEARRDKTKDQMGLKAVDKDTKKVYVAQASVIIDTCDQTGLLNKRENEVAKQQERKFQPIISARDHMRRYITGPTQILDTAALEHDYGIHIFRVKDLLKLLTPITTSRLGFQRVIRAYYMGATGGLKFKFRFTNCSDAQVAYYPPVPKMKEITPNQYWSSSSLACSNNVVRNVQYPANEFPNIARPSNSDYSSAPKIELTHETRMTGIMPVAEGRGDQSTMYSHILECTIPQMNCFEFMGDCTVTSSYDYDSFANDYGTIVVSYYVRSHDGEQPTNIEPTVTPMIAYADEARLGYNVFAPAYTPDYQGTYWTNPYQSNDFTPYDFEWSTTAPKCYIG